MQADIFKLLIVAVMITASVFDIKTKGEKVPDYLSLILIGVAFVNPNFDLKGSILGLLCGFIIFYGAYWINYLVCVLRKVPPTMGIGGADIKITAAFGFAIGHWDLVLLTATIAVWGSLLLRLGWQIISLFTGHKKETIQEQSDETAVQPKAEPELLPSTPESQQEPAETEVDAEKEDEAENETDISSEETPSSAKTPVPVYFVPFIAAGAIFSLLLI